MQSASIFERKTMSQNFTQPEEIDHILLETAWRDMRADTPDISLDASRADVAGLSPDLHLIDFGGAALADEKSELNCNRN